MSTCIWVAAWIGRCKSTANESGLCEVHVGQKCVSCGKPATHECEETMGLVCGYSLCDDCEHTICSNGCNSGAPLPPGLRHHCKKTEQVYKPWYMKESLT